MLVYRYILLLLLLLYCIIVDFCENGTRENDFICGAKAFPRSLKMYFGLRKASVFYSKPTLEFRQFAILRNIILIYIT